MFSECKGLIIRDGYLCVTYNNCISFYKLDNNFDIYISNLNDLFTLNLKNKELVHVIHQSNNPQDLLGLISKVAIQKKSKKIFSIFKILSLASSMLFVFYSIYFFYDFSKIKNDDLKNTKQTLIYNNQNHELKINEISEKDKVMIEEQFSKFTNGKNEGIDFKIENKSPSEILLEQLN